MEMINGTESMMDFLSKRQASKAMQTDGASRRR